MRNRKISVGSITYKTLATLVELALVPFDVASQATFYPSEFYGGYSTSKKKGGKYFLKNKHEAYLGLRNLRKQQLVVEQKDGLLALTPKARKEITKYSISKKIQNKPRWDGEWRVAVYDIAEVNREERDFLRGTFKYLGFYELQKSVWVFPYDVKRELRIFIALCREKLNGDLRFMTVKDIDGDEQLRKHFGLS